MDVLGGTGMRLVEEGFKHNFKNERIQTEIRTVEWGLRPKYWGRGGTHGEGQRVRDREDTGNCSEGCLIP